MGRPEKPPSSAYSLFSKEMLNTEFIKQNNKSPHPQQGTREPHMPYKLLTFTFTSQ